MAKTRKAYGGFFAVPRSIENCDWFRMKHARKVFFWLRIGMIKRHQTEFVFWQGRNDMAMQPHSLHTSVRELAKITEVSSTTAWEWINWFAKNGFIEVKRSKQSGLIIRMLESDAFHARYKAISEQKRTVVKPKDSSSYAKAEKPTRTTGEQDAKHESEHQKPSLQLGKKAGFQRAGDLVPNTFPNTNPDSRFKDLSRSLLDSDPRVRRIVDKSAKQVDLEDLIDERATERRKAEMLEAMLSEERRHRERGVSHANEVDAK